MLRWTCRAIVLAATLLGLPTPTIAQAPGSITGHLVDPSGLPLETVIVTLATAVPGGTATRTTRSDANGVFTLKDVPPGEHHLRFEFEGFRPAERVLVVAPGAALTLDVQLELAAIPQVVRVTRSPGEEPGAQPTPGELRVPGQTADRTPMGRTAEQAAEMAPGVTTNGPNRAVTMAGAFSYGNLFLVDDLVANDSTRGGARGFYIPDAVVETRVATGAIPVEFGRFQGGVVQTVTRAGGNATALTARVTVTNDHWRALTPYRGDATVNSRVPTWEITLGGPVVKKKLFYFIGAMGAGTEQNRTMAFAGGHYVYRDTEQRYEGKLTWTPGQGQTLRATYFQIQSSRENASSGTIMDRASLYDARSPESLAGVSYTRLLGRTVLFEARYSRRSLTSSGAGSNDTTLRGGTPIWDRSRSDARFNSPTGCAACPGSADLRDSQDFGARFSFTRRGARPHDVSTGVDVFQETRQTNSYQSGSGYRVRATRSIIQNGTVYPVFLSDRTTWIYWMPVTTSSTGNDLRTYSAYASDAWRLGKAITVKAGLRFDFNDDHNSVGGLAARESTWSPRVGFAWDPSASGRWLVSAGWSRYVTAIQSAVADAASPGGRPATYTYDYLGPAVNASVTTSLVSSADALSTLFTWFLAPPGVNRATRSAPSIPGVNVRVDPALGPLDTREFMAGVTRQLGRRGSVRVEAVHRTFLGFYATRRDTTTGTVTDATGATNDLQVVTNARSGASRSYDGLLTQLIYRPAARLQVSASYTLSSTFGNVDGEDAAIGPSMFTLGDYPEYRQARWNAPLGPLATDQRHRLRLWATWDLPTPNAVGRLTLGLVQCAESGVPWSAVGNINPKAYVVNPGYVTPPTSVSYYFSERGHYETDALFATDLSLNWWRPLPGAKKGQWFLRALLVNVLNAGAAIRVNRTVLTRNDSTVYQAFNPFAETPIAGVHFGYGSDFGKPISPSDYQAPREFTIAFGIRY